MFDLKVLGILGSPRKGGNTDSLLEAALKGAEAKGADIEKVALNDLNIKPCQECGGCDETARCTIKDDMQPLYKKLRSADRIILASPIFFGSITAQTKAMIDRCQCVWVEKFILKKPRKDKGRQKGIFLCAGGFNKEDFFKCASNCIKVFFTVMDIAYVDSLFFGSVDKKGAISEVSGALNKAKALGEKLIKT